MANLKEIRTRIASVSSTRQITSAMKMVSAAKLKKAQDAIIQLRPYAEKLSDILTNISSSLDASDETVYSKARPEKNILIVLFTSNRGLCGAFNANAIKLALHVSITKYEKLFANNNIKFMTVGKKGGDFLRAKKVPVHSTFNDLYEKPSFDKISPVAEEIMRMYMAGEVDRVILVYNKFKNAAMQQLTEEAFLPIPKKDKDAAGISFSSGTNYIYEPSQEEILEEIIPKTLKVQFYKALLDSNASEHGARMTAMHKATDNATDLLKDLNIKYNKARQASITGEILDIVGGAEALRG
jgi:F-type H+-transporting ATPase subunit gamma